MTVLAVFGLVATLPSPGVALERTRGATGAEVVFLRTPAEAALLPGIVAGEGIPGAVGARLHVAGLGRVVWREIRDEVDPQGARHPFYRQHLLPEGALGASLGGEAAAQGIELVGGELGLHYDRDGNLEMVFGTQFGNVEVLAAPRPPARGRLPAARGRRSEPGLLQLSGLAGCDVNVTALGLDKARRIFFHTLTHYCTSSTGWEDLPDLMILAAYHLYKQCPIGRPGDPALEEQRAVDEAFTAIGYPGSGYHECPY